ncbi:myosin light chain kinase 2, skeletal/cardiac muscle isoform X1 [Ictalurus furcatus]|uniref:myosin light chain kinase 2, skeletal/cardiac muscle isoform X1 n=1 Tax=Ictalurus furcatus TaxID=66913 RepID=UPI00235104A4|nr:myosin light chain kinase 2, skeletal/cardiac muscle isoform X1 [Ictalurus furcatus]XP_053485705.1 myosin light chain kinase 2, skeletal/cardiac muscle isoform X1 [Ictalurus furcatus]
MSSVEASPGFDLIQVRIESLSSKMDTLISIQEKVLYRLDSMSEELVGIERDMETLKVDKEEMPPASRTKGPARGIGGEMKEMCQEMNSIMTAVNKRSEQQTQKLEGMERLVMSIQQVVSFIGETVKTSRITELMFKGPAARKSKAALAPGCKNQDSKHGAKRQASGEPVPGKKTTSTKPEALTMTCEPSSPESTHKLKLHGPKHFLSSKKSFKFLCSSISLTSKLKDHKFKDGKEKGQLSFKGLKAQKKKKPPDTTDSASVRKQALLLEEVQKLNRENAERSISSTVSEAEEPLSQNLLDFILDQAKVPVVEHEELLPDSQESSTESKEEEEKAEEEKAEEEKAEEEKAEEEKADDIQDEADEVVDKSEEELKEVVEEESKEENSAMVDVMEAENTVAPQSAEPVSLHEVTTSSEHCASEPQTYEKTSQEANQDQTHAPEDLCGFFKAGDFEIHLDFSKKKKEEEEQFDDSECEQFFIDCTPPAAAPFSHRVVSAKPNQISNFYTINHQEILGGGRFGQVHKCIENSSGLTLAAKIIKTRNLKEKEVVKNEIQVMNQLDHANLIQLYAAYESKNDIILVLEFVDGGELFDRIIDENYTLTELDTVMFVRQICEGLRHIHKMYIIHLDLKPENILCVSRLTNKIKIIDFGLARKYNPREKLRVNFGTPEFLAPEVINYDFVSFNTDMWSLGVITYMLLSGLSPFLGDDDNETLNNILACQWNFEESEFKGISDEAKDFISRLLVYNRSWRIGAGEALKHPWLSDPLLHHHLHKKKNMCQSRRNSCVPPPES